MATLTERAGALLQCIQTEDPLPHTLRFDIQQEELVLEPSAPASDDEVLYYDALPVLRLSAKVAPAMAGCTLDAQATPEGVAVAIVLPAEQIGIWRGAKGMRPAG
jgi:hypothetical protein